MPTIISVTFSFLFFVFFFASINAFNITEILNDHPDFSSFNEQMTRTGLATTINARQTITVLVVDNGAIAAVSGLPEDQVKKVLSLHVVLDYYDMQKLGKMSNRSLLLTTLFQASGQAKGQQGFLNATKTQNGVVFGSAVEDSSLNSNLMRSVAAQPYNVSVLQVSSVIVPPNLSNSTSSPPTSKSPSPAVNAPAPAPSSNGTELATPPVSNAPEANAPSDASAPSSTDGPVSDGPESDAPTETSSSSAAAYYNCFGFDFGVGVGAIAWSFIMRAL